MKQLIITMVPFESWVTSMSIHNSCISWNMGCTWISEEGKMKNKLIHLKYFLSFYFVQLSCSRIYGVHHCCFAWHELFSIHWLLLSTHKHLKVILSWLFLIYLTIYCGASIFCGQLDIIKITAFDAQFDIWEAEDWEDVLIIPAQSYCMQK